MQLEHEASFLRSWAIMGVLLVGPFLAGPFVAFIAFTLFVTGRY
jgi:hypothetical protein